MKITPEHFAQLETSIKAFEAANVDACKAHKAAHTPTRYAWDILRAAGLMPFVCDTLYKYLNDTHIQTAVLRITKGEL